MDENIPIPKVHWKNVYFFLIHNVIEKKWQQVEIIPFVTYKMDYFSQNESESHVTTQNETDCYSVKCRKLHLKQVTLYFWNNVTQYL